MAAEQPALSFGGLLRQLRAEAKLTQEELAAAAGLSHRSISDLERGINRTARKETAQLLAGALGLAGPAEELFVAAARGRAPAAEVLAAVRRARPPGQVAAIASPYLGLNAFSEQDAPFFFGREAATTEVLDRMARLLAGAGLLVVSGVSGAGKSSLLRAGVLPQIRAAGLAGTPAAASWPCLLFTPTRAPLAELALHVAGLAGADAAETRRELEARPEGFALTARQAARARSRGPAQRSAAAQRPAAQRDPGQRRLLVVVDQFEQLFTQCADEDQRRAFITALHVATAAPEPGQAPALVVLGVRADFEAGCADYPQLAGPVQDRYLVTAMTERQLRMAITEPARKAGSKVDDELVSVLLAEVRNGQRGATGAGALPLLSHALDQAWRSRAGNTVTLADYERTGGIEGAVATSAQRTYDALTPGQRDSARQVFTRLAVPAIDGADTAVRATRVELTTGKTAAEVRDLEAVLEAFAAERLLTLAADTVEISHEVLLTAWPLLRDTWLAGTLADRVIRARLRSTVAEWEHHYRDPSYLYSGSLLEAATSTVAGIHATPARQPPLSPAEGAFLHASEGARRRTARRRRTATVGLLVLTLTAITAAGIAAHNAAAAAQQHTLALSRQLAAESLTANLTDPVLARRLAVAAWRVSDTSQADAVMGLLLAEQQQYRMLPADPGAVRGVAISPSGKLVASAGADGTVRLWNPVTGQPVGAPLNAGIGVDGGVHGVAFSLHGDLLAGAGADGMVRVWHPVRGRLACPPIPADTGPGGGVYGVAFSPNGQRLATADGDGTVGLWDPANGQPLGTYLRSSSRLRHNAVHGVAFSPDGTRLAAAYADGTVQVWNTITGNPAGKPIPTGSSALDGGVQGVAFSRHGGQLASADGNGNVQVWSLSIPKAPGMTFNTGSHVFGVAFSPDGTQLASAERDGTVRLWNPLSGRPAGTLAAPAVYASRSMLGVAFGPEGTMLASADGDGTVRLWNTTAHQPAGAPAFTDAPKNTDTRNNTVAFSPDGTLLAGGSPAGTLGVLKMATGSTVGTPGLAGISGGVGPITFSTDSALLASIHGESTVQLWKPLSGRPAGWSFSTGANAAVVALGFSPDGTRLATVDVDGTVRLWVPSNGESGGLNFPGAGGGVTAAGFSPGGKLLAIASAGAVRLWHSFTGQPAGRPIPASTGLGHGVRAVAFSPGGRFLAIASADGMVQLWNPFTSRPAGPLIPAGAGHDGGVRAMAFSPNGELLATAGADGMVRLWNPFTGQLTGAPIPVDIGPGGGVDGVVISPDGRLLASADAGGAVRLWEVSLFVHPYETLCHDVGAPTRQDWAQNTSGEPPPRICG